MSKNTSGQSVKAPLLVFIPPTNWLPEKVEQLHLAAAELIKQLDLTGTGGEIVGVSLEKIIHAGSVMQVSMTISILTPD